MEKILIPIFSDYTNIWTVIYGMQLAQRTSGKVYILEKLTKEKIHSQEHRSSITESSKYNFNIKEVDYAHVKIVGDLVTNCIGFIKEEQIDLVVVSIPEFSPYKEDILRLIKEIEAKELCKIELIKNKKGVL